MINGVDLLFMVVGVILLFTLVYFTEKYANWLEQNHRRRRQRVRALMLVREEFEEEEYLAHLRMIARLNFFTETMNHIAVATRRATESMEDFTRAFTRSR